MAGDWIKIEHATIDKPEVLQIAELLGINSDEVLGKLIRVWAWFDKQSRDGNAGSVTLVTLTNFINRLVALQGFAECMLKVGWLTDCGIPNFEVHNGESSKKRALAQRRQKTFRNANVTLGALPEKRREEKPPIVPHRGTVNGADADAAKLFADFWQHWPASLRKGSRPQCLKVWTDRGLWQLSDEIVAHVEAMKTSKQWQDQTLIPAPLVYLNQSRWDGAELPATGTYAEREPFPI